MFAGVPLPEIESEIERYGLFVRKFRHEISTTCTFLRPSRAAYPTLIYLFHRHRSLSAVHRLLDRSSYRPSRNRRRSFHIE